MPTLSEGGPVCAGMNRTYSENRGEHEAFWDWNLVSSRIHYSPRWISLVGCEEHEVGTTQDAWFDRIHPDDLSHVLSTVDAHIADGPPEFDIRHRMLHKGGSYRWMSCRGVIQRNAAGQAVRVIGSHVDVTAETVADPLTGLPNRLLFLEHLTRSLERANRQPGHHFAVLSIDLDRPAPATEPLGPTVEDLLLTAAARRLETSVRVSDPPRAVHNDLVARMHGDQFAILIDGLKDVSQAKAIAERILVDLAAPFTLGDGEVFLSPSIGIAVSATGYAQVDDVLRDAETALHRARLLGKGCCEVFDTAIFRSAQTEVRLEGDFAEALERSEFRLHYQPIVSLAAGHIVGFEALVRWQHPVFGLISAAEFVPTAEKTGFIVPLGNWILREASRQLRAWQDELQLSKDVWISLNLSSVQFKHSALVSQVVDALSSSTLEPRCLVLELTEGLAMENHTAVKALLMQLRAIGVRISVDDFGTGHSSLAYLRKFPVDSLKIDRSLVRGIESNVDMTHIVGALTAMAHQLGLRVVAEGIDNDRQLALVRSLQCEYGQGYLFSKPVDSDAAASLLKSGFRAQPARPTEQNTATIARREEPALAGGDSRVRTSGALIVVTAAVTLLVSAALATRFVRGSGPAAQSASTPSGLRPSGESAAPHPAAAPETLTRQASDQAPDSAAASAPRAPQSLTSFPVIHQHRLGSCRGLLVVSRRGVTFVPDKAKGQINDAFSFRHGDFLYAVTDEKLTIKSAARTYRFEAAGATRSGNAEDLKRIVGSITRLRQES